MEFISENYIWIIIIAVVIIMTVIGYIADKTDFGKKPVKEKKIKEKKITKEEKDVVEDDQNLDFQLNENEMTEMIEPAFDTDEMDLGTSFDDEMELKTQDNIIGDNLENNQIEEDIKFDESNIETPSFELKEDNNINTLEASEEPSFELKEEKEDTTVDNESLEESNFNNETNEDTNFEPEMNSFELPKDDSEEKISNDLLGNNDDLDIELPSIESLNKELSNDTEDDDVWKF
ncbi:MAG: hypothetical protein PHN42_01255 [Bacilli bacterium]|nr:hypothetical protein [Bacilli bacterium]